MELWQIVVICLAMFPAFFVANYVMVKKAVEEKKRRDNIMEKVIASSVNRKMSSSGQNRFRPKPRYGVKKKY
jgi:hypothetical protein